MEDGLIKGCQRSHPHEEMNEVCELKTEIARLKNELSHWSWVRFKQLEEENKTLREALELYKQASYQPHYSHVDWTGGAGAGCEACIRAMNLREQAQQALKEVS